jgi:hypothetical protein
MKCTDNLQKRPAQVITALAKGSISILYSLGTVAIVATTLPKVTSLQFAARQRRTFLPTDNTRQPMLKALILRRSEKPTGIQKIRGIGMAVALHLRVLPNNRRQEAKPRARLFLAEKLEEAQRARPFQGTRLEGILHARPFQE